MFFNKFFKQEQQPLTVKPLDTKVEFITDSSGNFQIVVPSQKVNFKAILSLFAIAGILVFLARSLQNIDFLKDNLIANILIYWPSYILPCLFILLLIVEILFALYGETVITGKNAWVSLGYIVFGIKFFSLYLFPRANISEIIANRYTKTSPSGADGDEEINTIILWAGKIKYELGCNEDNLNFSYFDLTRAEMNWLATELSACLDLPIFEKFWRVKGKESSLEFRRIAVTWIVPSFFIISYFLIAIGSLGIAQNFSDPIAAFLSINSIALVLGIFLAIFNLGYIASWQQMDGGSNDLDYLEQVFSKLVREGEGEISLVLFRRETGLSYQEASEYLGKKVEMLNAVYVKRQNNIYYYFKF